MDSPQQRPSAAFGPADFPTVLDRLRRRIDTLGATDAEPVVPDLVQDLESAYEELRVADEEVRTQQDEINDLLSGRDVMSAQHRRLLTVLPIPVLVTDRVGVLRSVNAAAAALVGLQVSLLLGKPVFSFLAIDDRPVARRELGSLSREASRFHRVVTVLTRDDRAVGVEAHASLGASGEVTWLLLVPGTADAEAGAATGGSLPEALVRLAQLPSSGLAVDESLRGAAQVCQDALGTRATASVTVGSPQAPQAVVSTSSLAQAVDGAQIAAGEGPCVEAFSGAVTIVSADLTRDDRWPRLAGDARVAGAGGAVAVPLKIGDDVLGALNAYAPSGAAPDEHLIQAVELLGSAVAALLHEVSVRAELQKLSQDMDRALSSRAVIDQAKGILMARLQIGPDEAFQHLVGLSSSQHVKLRDVARDLIDQHLQRTRPE